MPAQAQRMSRLLASDKEFAPCRVERRACVMRGERAWGGGESGVHGEGPTQGWRGQGTCGAHVEHPAHARDLGRVEAERLVERRRALPSQKEYAWEGPTKRLFYNWEGPTQRLWWLRA